MPKDSERIILATSATGRQGGAVYQHLQRKGFKLLALVRDPNSNKARQRMRNGEEVFQRSLDDPKSSRAGDESSMQQIADAFSRVTARGMNFVQVSWDQFEKNMRQELTVMYRWFEEKGFHLNIEQVRREYPPTQTFNRWLEAHWNTTLGEHRAVSPGTLPPSLWR